MVRVGGFRGFNIPQKERISKNEHEDRSVWWF